MKTKTTKLLFGMILVMSLVFGTYAIMAEGFSVTPAVIWTDKPDYKAGEIVSIFGSGFNLNAYLDIPVIRPDGTIVKGDGTFTPGWDMVQADGNGNFAYYYKLDGISGTYEVRVYASPWSRSLGETPLANTTFTDANPAANLDQARNGAFNSPVSPVDWQNGNLGGQTAHFVEGYSVPYRAVLTDMPTGKPITLIMSYKVKDSFNNALDYLTNYNRINYPPHQDVFGHTAETINPLRTGTGTSLTAAKAAFISSTITTFVIPTPPTLNTPVPGQPTGSYNNVIANEGIAAERMTLYGGTISNIAYDSPIADLSLQNVYQPIVVTFSLDNTTAVLAWGGHIASRADWGFFPDGEPRSAGGINGSPYHMAIDDWNSTDVATDRALGNLGAQDRSLSAVAVFAPPVPFIALTKTPSATKVLNTTQVTYTYNVTNTGGVDFTNVTIVDDTFGTITSGQTLNINQSKTFTHITTLNQTTTNIATVFGTTGANATVNATATATVTVIHPSLSLTKTPSANKVENGTLVTYTYNVTNTGDTSLTVSLVDDTFGTLFTGKVLAPGAFNVTVISSTLTTTTTNVATATGVDQLGTNVTAQATATVTVLHPSITLTKMPSSTKVENGTLVVYTYNLTNTGDVSLSGNITDNIFGLIGSFALTPGASTKFTKNVTLTANTTNTATAIGVDQLGASVSAEDTATVTVIHPSLSLSKSASSSKVENGSSVTYTYNLTNTGDTSLSGNITDNVFGFIGSFVLSPGSFEAFNKTVTLTQNTTNTAIAVGIDQLGTTVSAQATATVTVLHPDIQLTKTPSSTKVENGTVVFYTYNITNMGEVALSGNVTDDIFGEVGIFTNLQPGNWVAFTIPHMLTVNTTNIATATGVDQLGTSVSAQDSASVTVLHPAISLTKTPSSTKVENGSSVTYVYNVTNTGDTSLSGNITDNVFGFVGSFVLPAGSWMTFNKTVTLTANTTNTANAAGVDQLGTTVSAQATATVTVLHPSISLTKTPSANKVENGTNVTYVYNVTNTGDVALTGNVTDDIFGSIGTFTNLQPGQWITFNSSHVLTATTTNIATAIGVDQLGTSVTAQASTTVTVLHPAITLTKTPSATKVENGTIVFYTYNVTNTGDVALSGNVTDNVFGLVGTFTNLQAGQWVVLAVPHALTANTTNTATAVGVDQLGASVQAQDSATVTVLHPAIALTKTPSATKVENGTIVTYTYNVTNTGETSLSGNVTDDTFGLIGSFALTPGSWMTFAKNATLTTTTTNVAMATGVDQLGANVTAQASATVTVLHPAITLTKTPSATKVENGSSVSYTYNVTNTGDVTLSGNVTDDIFGLVGLFTNLPSGDWVAFAIFHVLTTNTTNTAMAIGVDQLGTSAQDQATAFVQVIHPSISLTKTPSSTKVERGTSVTYTYNITNTGDTSLNGNLTDNTFGFIGSFFGLPAGGFATFTKSHALNITTTNIATVFAVDQLGARINANATATVTVISPSLSLVKSPSSSKVVTGSNVTYTYNVTNTGDTALTGNVTDDMFGLIGTFTLQPGTSTTFTKTTTLTVDTTNIATATGIDQLGANATATSGSFVVVTHPGISIVKTCSPEDQLAPGNITWTVLVKNTGDVPLTNIHINESRSTLINLTIAGPLVPNETITIIFNEFNLPPGTYYNNATVTAAHQLGTVSSWDDATCTVRPVFILKQFTNVTVLPIGLSEGFNATLVNSTDVSIIGLNSGPKIYFTITYYFENSLNFLGSSFDGQAHNFTLWDKWGGNLMALGSPPIAFNQKTNVVTLADNSTFKIDPTLSGPGTYRGYIGSGRNISNLASQGQAWITMHLGDQQNSTNPGRGKGTSKDSNSYDTDTVWYIGELGVNQSATLTLYVAPGKNPGGKLQFSSPGCTVINTGPRVRAYGNTFANEDFLYAVERTNTLTVCVSPKP